MTCALKQVDVVLRALVFDRFEKALRFCICRNRVKASRSAGSASSPATEAAAATSAVSSRSPATRSGNSGLVTAEIPSDWAACDFLHDDETATRSGDLSPVPAIFFSTVNGFLYALQCTNRTGNKQNFSDHLSKGQENSGGKILFLAFIEEDGDSI
ncbi:hypothetical protein MRB53_014145 [Persea americana]|uniref:Uncharacterized protein n=1 Tax=Persea americana TaxID=3435 RepID=A0ACC2KA14_PERAE|nr:hypothetical protein MRB53_014145 [Persea americana]